MKNLTVGEIQFSESCCAGHSFVAEHVRDDGIGFLLNLDPEAGLYSGQVFEADHTTVRSDFSGLTEDEVNSLLNS